MEDSGNTPSDGSKQYVFRLYVCGTTPTSSRAIVNTRRLLEDHLEGQYDLEVVDIVLDPSQAARQQIIAAPTLVKESPVPLQRFIGDMSQTDRIVRGLGIRTNQ